MIKRRFIPDVKSEINCTSDDLVKTTKTTLPCSPAVDQPVSWISFRFACFCHTFPGSKYPQNSPAGTQQFGLLNNQSLIRCFVL